MAHLHEIVFDSCHPASIARFWAAALDGYEVAPYDEAELHRLRGNGITSTEDDPAVRIQASNASRPGILFQLVPEPMAIKNRVHLDLRCESFDAESKRLTEPGASVVAGHDTFIVLADPEGNEFCLSRRTGS
jgi:hypothetical protein